MPRSNINHYPARRHAISGPQPTHFGQLAVLQYVSRGAEDLFGDRHSAEAW